MTGFKFLLLVVLLITFAQTEVFADGLADGSTAAQKGDFQTAFKLWKPLADQGNAEAQFNLGVMYENGKGVTKDDMKAVKWYRMAAEQGDASAQINLGFMYEKGKGVAEDDIEAVKWYRMAAEQGDADAQSNLGEMYMLGKGVKKSAVDAYVWFSFAAAKGDKKAKKGKATISKEMTPAQIDEAQKKSTVY